MVVLAWLAILAAAILNLASLGYAVGSAREAGRDRLALDGRGLVDARLLLAVGERRMALYRVAMAAALAAANITVVVIIGTATFVRGVTVTALWWLVLAHLAVYLEARASRTLRRAVRRMVAHELRDGP